MAKENSGLSGAIGPIVTYMLNGKQVVRSRPKKYTQTPATVARGKNFGIASRVGAQVRAGIGELTPFPNDTQLQAKLAGAISRWLGTTAIGDLSADENVPFVSGFQFNPDSALNSRWKQCLQIGTTPEQQLQLNIASFDPAKIIMAPSGTKTVRCEFSVVSCDIAATTLQQTFRAEVSIDYTQEWIAGRVIDFPISIQPTHLIVIAASMRFEGSRLGIWLGENKRKKWPLEVIGAIYGKPAHQRGS